jgi:hypothetical protein
MEKISGFGTTFAGGRAVMASKPVFYLLCCHYGASLFDNLLYCCFVFFFFPIIFVFTEATNDLVQLS